MGLDVERIDSTPEMLGLYKEFIAPNGREFSKTFSSKTVEEVAGEVAELYTFFLTQAAHSPDRVAELQAKGIRVTADIDQNYPSPKELAQFQKGLKKHISSWLQSPLLVYSIEWGPSLDHPGHILNCLLPEGYFHLFPKPFYTKLESDSDEETVQLTIVAEEKEEV